jgi:hypothetical protein
MLSNTGSVSLVLYAIFILIAIGGSIIAIVFIAKGTIAADKIDKIIELAKYTIVSTAIATVTLIVADLFKEREQDIKELEYFDKYVQDVKKVDGIEERFLLSKYLSIVAPSGELKKSWKQYYDTLNIEYQEYLHLKKEKERLDTISNPTEEQLEKKQQITEKIQMKETPIVSSTVYENIPTSVYIHISDESQRQMAKLLESTLINEGFVIPGIENIGKKPNIFIPSRTEVRYYRIEELAGAQRLIAILKSQQPSMAINETPVKISGTGRGTRAGHFEIWFRKSTRQNTNEIEQTPQPVSPSKVTADKPPSQTAEATYRTIYENDRYTGTNYQSSLIDNIIVYADQVFRNDNRATIRLGFNEQDITGELSVKAGDTITRLSNDQHYKLTLIPNRFGRRGTVNVMYYHVKVEKKQ